MNHLKVFIVNSLFLSALVLIFICSFTQSVLATTIYDNLNALKNAPSALEDPANALQEQENLLVTPAQSIQASIDVLKSTIDQENLDIEQRKKTIENLVTEQQNLADQQKKDTETLGIFVRNQYTDSDSPLIAYLSWLAGSTIG